MRVRPRIMHAQAQHAAVMALGYLITGSAADRLPNFALQAGVLRVGLLESDICVSCARLLCTSRELC